MEIAAGESLEISVYTRSNAGATFSVVEADTKSVLVEAADVTHSGEGDSPLSVQLNNGQPMKGPLKLKIKAESKGSRFSTNNYMLVFGFKK